MAERPCSTCDGTGEIGPRNASRAEYEARVRPCHDCDGTGDLDAPVPTWMDGDYQLDTREGF